MGKRNKRRKNRHHFEWRKPGYYRSDPKVVKADKVPIPAYHGPIAPDNTTRWESISEDTFEELKSRGVLTPAQIRACEERFAKSPKKRKSGGGGGGRGNMGWLSRHPDEELIREIAKLDLLTPEGIQAFKKIVDVNPRALDLVDKARKVRGAG